MPANGSAGNPSGSARKADQPAGPDRANRRRSTSISVAAPLSSIVPQSRSRDGTDGTLLDYDLREVKVAQAIMETANEKILVADSMKFERRAPVRIGHLRQIDVFVTDVPPPQSIIDMCAENDVRIVIASAKTSGNSAS